jgi:hypothetical protein
MVAVSVFPPPSSRRIRSPSASPPRASTVNEARSPATVAMFAVARRKASTPAGPIDPFV